MPEKIIIFDTTLRDGRQFLRPDISIDDKLEIVQSLDRLGVAVIEVGFVSVKGDEEVVRRISQVVENAIVCVIAKSKKEGIEMASAMLKKAKRSRIHIFTPTNLNPTKKDLGEYQSDMNEGQTLQSIREAVSCARNVSADVEWTALDATRSRKGFLFKAVETAISAGATTVNIPDTMGIRLPSEFGELISEIRNQAANVDKVVLSVHCHNLLGLATANSLEAVRNGARQVECTINGIGATGGNTSLAQLIGAIEARRDLFPYHHSLDLDYLPRVSQLVSGSDTH